MEPGQMKTIAAAIAAILTVGVAAYLIVPSPMSLHELAEMEEARHERERSKALQAAFKTVTDPARAQTVWKTLPPAEQLFCGALVRRLADFSTTTSASKREKARKHRAEGVKKAVPNGEFIGWKLTVDSVENGSIRLRLPEPCANFHLLGLGESRAGAEVIVSGSFLDDPESTDGFAENSSRLEDTMTHPEYTVVIHSIEAG